MTLKNALVAFYLSFSKIIWYCAY